jgi:AcrR family transcriptional regulator
MKQQRRTQAARSQAARDQIVQAALTVFALKGYAAASMDDLCLAAGCSKGGLYHHFPTKSAVLGGVVDRLTSRGALLPPFPGAGDGSMPPQALGRILIEIWTEAARDETLRSRLRAGYEAQLDQKLQDPVRTDAGLTTILRIGTLIQLLTRSEAVDAAAIARRLGIDQAA